ncbi:hypothetical protein B0F90DRAFT_1808891 [Multifurca ochricompacta]|uniref:U2 snRNP-associated SURP motif-containing protein n=1 Tax=Multifurca ochricompacta TaxID=376703 RepID=A0AAD4QPK0_9AGAM|nr:hypothetical protein B0F90DRAFT_1808891 [Multifurca ochricompacta]
MDKTKSKLAAFFDNDEDDSSFPQKTVDDQKLSQYAQGTVKKSKREKEKEAAEAKRKEEEEHAAKAYAEFLDAFDADDSGPSRRGGKSGAFVRSSKDAGTAYTPSGLSRLDTQPRAMRAFETSKSPSPPVAPKPKGKRAMDAFLEEIKRDQADREARFARNSYEGQSGSKDRGDPETSNIFVANLPPHVTEQSLGNFFARMGPVGSVKIMWPRGDSAFGPGADMTAARRNRNSGLSGFVSFMKRKDAEAALKEFDGFDWGGSVLRVGWSKAVPVAAKPMYVAQRSRSPSPFPQRRRSRSRSRERDYRRDWRSRSRSYSPRRGSRYSRSPRRSYGRYSKRSRSPRGRRSPRGHATDDEEVTDSFVRTVAVEVKGHGKNYEDSLKEMEKENSRYSFLMDRNHRKYRLYQSLPEFEDEGYNSVFSTDSAEDGSRGELARCMAFSLEHAEAANEIADIIIASLVVDGTPVPRKLARLHLICDILHNSAAPLPMAWKFRQEFQSRLGLVFDHFSTIYHSFPGRITAETFKSQITGVVDIWEDWIVFPPEFTLQMRRRIEGQVHEEAPKVEEAPVAAEEPVPAPVSRFKASSFKPAEEFAELPKATISPDTGGEKPMDVGSDVDGQPLADLDGEPLDNTGKLIDDIDGTPMDDDIDGVPLEDDIDGAPLDDDIDGAPMEDVDGEPMI